MHTKWIVAVGAMAMLTVGAGQAAAQQMIAPDSVVSGRLDTRDPVSSTGGRFDRWRVEAQPGELVVLRMNSGEFDPLVQIGRTGPGGQFYELASDDDGAGYPNTLLQYRAAEGGQYEVRATSFGSDVYGGYTLSRSSQAVNTGPSAYGEGYLPIDVGGYIDYDDPTDVDGRSYEAYRFRLPPHHVMRIRQESDEVDSYVMIGLINAAGEWVGLLHDDDSGGGLNSEFFYQSVSDDLFEVRASTYSPGATGAYRVILENVSATADGGLPAGLIVDGWITPEDNFDGRANYEYRTFYAIAGQTVTATYRSNEFDALLAVGEWSSGAFHEMWRDDDSGGGETGFDAQSTFVAPFTGLYTAWLGTYSAGETGKFTFEVQAY